ncbi:sensor histidine kinase [Actinoallomurus iriomotensis]|uniref:histidine kinase n=1 Tax=Actinoallomurus iriomotensis TaxID=478107 RepID=A0A9W6RN95_9ACTN|nr:sensor domain-containing protein [Actinoallomurus iriomotensis]GLY78778.1 histidine kinase [Actinoallomurus iriomotensis]
MTLGTVLRAPVSRRAWAEIAYVLVNTPLAALGFAYVVATLVLGAGLAVSAAGFPLLAAGLVGARRIGGLHRGLAGRFLGERIEAPARPVAARGPLGRMQTRLSDAVGWRTMGYLLLKFPVVALQVYVLTLTWVWGVVLVTRPLQNALDLNQGAPGSHTLFDNGALMCVGGVALLFLAPWAMHVATIPDRLLARWLLGRRGLQERVRDLEETRAHAVDDAAATLRRIERDLHDGAQVRLIALTMQLTMVRDVVTDEAARALVDNARATAKEAVVELRELVRGIHPPALDHGLDTALTTLAARSAVPVETEIALAARPTAAIESIAYFCAAELLANAAKHSGASRIRLSLTQQDDRLCLRVHDDGRGGAALGGGSGLSGLLDRVRTVDGRIDVSSPPGGPTVVTVELPSHA